MTENKRVITGFFKIHNAVKSDLDRDFAATVESNQILKKSQVVYATLRSNVMKTGLLRSRLELDCVDQYGSPLGPTTLVGWEKS